MKQSITYGLLILAVCCFALSAFSQSPFYRPAKYKWDDPLPKLLKMDPQYAEEDAVILEESNGIRVHKVNPLMMSIVFEKHVRIRYNTIAGIDQHSKFVLPESFDPMYDLQEVPLDQRKSKIRPQYFDVEVDFFAARIIRPDGAVIDAIVNDSVALDRLKFGIKIHDTWSFVFNVSGMEPGDELEVHYKYVVPYRVNWFRFNRNRVFFHSAIPKQKFELVFRADERQDLIVEHTPAQKVDKQKSIRTYQWKYENMPGCMDETNARPHLDLPYFIYGLSQSNLLYRYRHNLSYELLEIPYWTFILKLRESRALWLRRVSKKNLPDKQNRKFNEFTKEVFASENYSSKIEKAELLHEHIAKEFKYKSDDDWFDDLHGGLQKIGDNVEDGILRELSRYDLYAKMLYKLDLNYHTAYLFDKRTGVINNTFLSPIWDNEWAFVLFDSEGPVFLHSKREDHGWLANEFPFYWEGSTALLAQVDMLWSDFEQIPQFIDIPETEALANFRTTNVRVGVDLNKGRTTFDAKVTLNGQFETMTASAYENNEVDSTISAEYAAKVYALKGSVNVVEQNETFRTDDPPFRSQIRMKYVCRDLIEEEENGTWTMDLSGILNYVAPDEYDASTRDLPFYWDFMFLDNFNYQLVFDKDIELLDASSSNINMNSILGDVMFRCEKTSANTIMISSFLQVRKEMVVVSEAQILQEMLDVVNGLSELKITIAKTDRSDP